MERNRDLRRTTMSAVNGLPRRRQRITPLRDSADQDKQMELQETVRLGGGEREFPKRRRIDRSAVKQRSDGGENCRDDSTDSSDEEYYEEEERMRIHRTNQLSPPSSSLTINRRGLRTLRSSPIPRAAVDEMLGVHVPRRARSSSAKRLHEYCNSGSGDFGEDLNRRRSSHSPVHLIGPGVSMKKKMRSAERRTTPVSDPPKCSVFQDDIEIEVAEALFDLMKQSQSSQRHVDGDGVIPATDEVKMSKADGGKDENNGFSVQNEPSIKVNAETANLADSMKELKKEGTVEKEKFSDGSTQDLVSGDVFVNKVKVGFPKESESPSCVKAITCDIQDPTVTKAHNDAIIVEAKTETKLEIDLMAPLPSSLDREGVMTQAVLMDGPLAVASRLQGEKTGEINSNQQSNLDVEKRSHDTTHQQGLKEHKNQSPTSLLPYPYGLSGWPGVVPHPGFMPPLQAVMPINGSAKSSKIMQPPQFNFSGSRSRRCATHQFLARSMHCHQQLIKKTLSFGSTSPAASSRSKSQNLKYIPPAENLIPGNPLLLDFQGGQNLTTASVASGKDKNSDAAVAFNTMTSKPLLQTSNPASASSFLHGPGFVLPFDHHQTTATGLANSSGSSQSASLPPNSAGKLPLNLPLPNASTAISLNLPVFPSNEAVPYMAMLQNNGCSVPISTNIAVPSFKGGPPSLAFFNPLLYPSLASNVNQNQQQLTPSHASVQSVSQNLNLLSHKQPQCLQQTGAKISEYKFPTSASGNSQPEKPLQPSQISSKSDTDINWKNGASFFSGFGSHSGTRSGSQTCSLSAQPMNFSLMPSLPVGSGGGNKQIDPPQGSKGRVELIPQAFAWSFGSNASATPVLSFSSMAHTSAMHPDMSRNGNQMLHHKNFQSSEGKSLPSAGNFSNSDISSTLSKFDRNINFHASSATGGSQPFQTSTTALSSGLQLQQHHLDFHMHLAGTPQVKSSTPHSIPGSFFTGVKWENSAPEGCPQLKTSQGQTNINFGNGPISAASFQGHQFVIKNESLMVGSCLSRNTGSSQRNASSVGAAIEAEASQGGGASHSQKSSPACRRNVASILSTCPSQLPELKY